MAITVEDGTGKADAETYLSVADFKAYCDARGYAYSGNSDSVIEQKLRLAAAYIDTFARFKAVRLVSDQALEFPRSGLVDWSGITVTGVPKRVKDACAELAFKALSENLYSDADRGGMVKSESVGPISVTYADGAPAQKLFSSAVNLLKPYLRDERDSIGAPVFGGSDEGYFSAGMHDNTSGTT